MAPRSRACPVCGSKQWHKEAHSGLVACSEGHILQDYRKETRDAYDVGAAGLRKRTVKQQRKQKGKSKSKANNNILHGLEGRYHYFQCLQLLLRKQIFALAHLWSLPSAFETVCRDIWALHLSLLSDPVPAEPYLHAQENSLGKLEEEEPSSSSELDDEELQELLRENSESSNDETDATHLKSKNIDEDQRRRRRGPRNEPEETLLGNLSVLIVACWTLRIPVLYRDFRTFIESYDLPYLDATTQLPQAMRIHLSKTKVQSLSPSHTPSTLLLHGVSARLARHLLTRFGVYTPEINAAHLLWRTVKALGGNVALYCLVKRISHALSLPLTLSPALAPRLPVVTAQDPGEHVCDNAPPELAFAAAAIIALKMIYGLDGLERAPSKGDLACDMLCCQDYRALVRDLIKQENESKEQLYHSETPMHIGELDKATIDNYLDLCEKALLGDKQGISNIPELDTLDQYFPLIGKPSVPVDLNHHEECNPGLEHRPVGAAVGTGPSPGQKYVVYFGDDVGGEVEAQYELILQRAAAWVGVDVEDLHPIIEAFERRLLRWWRKEGRRRAGSMESDSSED